MAQNLPYQRDGDAAFVKVDTRRPAHELEPGTCADALNKRFEDGRAWPRFNVNVQPWGTLPSRGANVTPAGNYPAGLYVEIPTVIGHQYEITAGANEDAGHSFVDNYQVIANPGAGVPVVYTATYGNLKVYGGTEGAAVTVQVRPVIGAQTPQGYSRFSDPATVDCQVVVTDSWRPEDGGRGRAYRVQAGQNPIPIPLNGQDVWGMSRLVPCHNGLALVRQGNERHYFAAAAVDQAGSQIQLNCAPAWADGDAVFYHAEPDSYITGTKPPNPDTLYWVKNIAGNKVELYTAATLAGDKALDLSTGAALGRFYLERRAESPGAYGNGAPPLLMQPDGSGQTAFEVGFKAVPVRVAVTAFDSSTKVCTAPNHRLIPADKVKYRHNDGTEETFYARPLSEDKLTLHADADHALAGDTPQDLTPAWNANDTLRKDGASGLPMPPAREGIYLPINRLVLVNGRNNLAISDPLDPLHFSPFLASVTANLGEADPVNSLCPLGKDSFIIGKQNSILAFSGIAGASSGWAVTEVTREYGFEAPLATVPVGRDVWGFGRKGVVSVAQTDTGTVQGVALPVSFPMKKYLDRVDWRYAAQACAATWNNRFFLALPLKGQTGTVKNNGILVYNTLNQGWEGLWQGELLEVYAFARHIVYGEERLCFVNYAGQVCWLGDGLADNGQPIPDKLVTRIYTAGDQRAKTWLRADVIWDTHNPKLSVTAQAPGHNETWPLLTDKQYNPAKYLQAGKADYDPVTGDFDAPGREDYSLTPGELLKGELDVHQNIPEQLRMRVCDWGVQLVIENKQGSARVQSVEVQGVNTFALASRTH